MRGHWTLLDLLGLAVLFFRRQGFTRCAERLLSALRRLTIDENMAEGRKSFISPRQAEDFGLHESDIKRRKASPL